MAFLSIFTPTFRRPTFLAQCRASVAEQTTSVEHVVVEDVDHIGCHPMIRKHANKVTGEYVMVLSDDNILVDDEFAEDLPLFALGHDDPDVIVFKGDIVGPIFPQTWEEEPVEGKIDLSNFAVRRDVWLDHVGDWKDRREGDFDFIHAVWADGHTFAWWDRLIYKALQIGWFQPE